MTSPASLRRIRSLPREQLHRFIEENVRGLLEDEAVAALENPHADSRVCDAIAQTQSLTAYGSVRTRLVAHRATPRGHALKLVHYLPWRDLLRLSIDVTVPAPVRRAIDTQMLLKAPELPVGERIASARSCSAALVSHFLTDDDERVLSSLLVNPRLREEELVAFASSPRATSEQLTVLAGDTKWSQRRAIRKALALNPSTPKSIAAAQLLHLTGREIEAIYGHPAASVYMKRCIERLGRVPQRRQNVARDNAENGSEG